MCPITLGRIYILTKHSMTQSAPGFNSSPALFSQLDAPTSPRENRGRKHYQSDVDEGTIPAYTSLGGKRQFWGRAAWRPAACRRTLAFWGDSFTGALSRKQPAGWFCHFHGPGKALPPRDTFPNAAVFVAEGPAPLQLGVSPGETIKRGYKVFQLPNHLIAQLTEFFLEAHARRRQAQVPPPQNPAAFGKVSREGWLRRWQLRPPYPLPRGIPGAESGPQVLSS
jgi:hypothetical protein